MARPRERDSATLLDRLALAFLSGVSAALLGAILWGAIAASVSVLHPLPVPSPAWILWFALAMAVLGFFTNENLVGDLVGGLLRRVLSLIRSWWL